MVLLIELVLLYIELKRQDETFCFGFRRELILGILAGVTILLKQTTGIIFVIIFAFYKIMISPNWRETKECIKISFTRLLGSIIPVLFLIIYLLKNGIWDDFVDYAILGVSTFSNQYSYLRLFIEGNFIIKILAILVPLQIILMAITYMFSAYKKEITERKWFRELFLLLAYSIAASAVMIPIADKNHFPIFSIIPIISLVIFTYKILASKTKENLKIKAKVKKYIWVLSIVLFIVGICQSMYLNIAGFWLSNERRTDMKHFNNIIIEEYFYVAINNIDKVILAMEDSGRELYILHSSAAAYMIPIDRYHKNYDMLNKGNIGTLGEKRNYRRFKQKGRFSYSPFKR